MCCDGVGGQVVGGLVRGALALRLSPPDRGDLAIIPCPLPCVPWRMFLAMGGFITRPVLPPILERGALSPYEEGVQRLQGG